MRIGINGLGRIGRGLLKSLWDDDRFEVVALNDVAEGFVLAHLLNWDSYYGRWANRVESSPSGLRSGAREVPLYHGCRPTEIPWDDAGVDCVVDATGRFKDRASLLGHGRPVILTASSRQVDRQVVYGVNHREILDGETILSATSCTTHCVVPPVHALKRRFGCRSLWFNTVHCYNVSQPLVDAPLNDLRRARAGALNLIPTTTSASLSVEAVLPDLAGRVHGMAVRVPAPAVSLTEMTMISARPMDHVAVLSCLEEAAEGDLKGILALSRENLVSQDFLGRLASSIVDVPLLDVADGAVRLIAWYDNESGYVARLVDLLAYLKERTP
jgi:glyceraldehyde 3-phosphate dehydrogenase